MQYALQFNHRKNIGSLGFWLDYFGSDFVQCENRHDAFYAARCMLKWDPHFEIPSVNYRKSSFQLAIEILPHLDQAGTQFPTNVELLLQLLDFNPTLKEVDQDDLHRLRATRRRRHRRTIEVDQAYECHSNCDCASSRTAVWICHQSFTVEEDVPNDEQRFEQHFGRMDRAVDNGLEILVRRSSHPRDHFSDLLRENRPDDCLCVIGFDLDTKIRSVVGLITPHATAGDFLIRSPGPSWWSYLVLRRAIGEIYEIVGHAVLDPHVRVQPYGLESSDNRRSASEPITLERTIPEPEFGFDFWFDDEDVLAYILATKDIERGPTLSPKALQLLHSTFTRSRFSSFATPCFDAELRDGGIYCPQCAIGYNVCICIHCGVRLKEPASPYFRQDPVER